MFVSFGSRNQRTVWPVMLALFLIAGLAHAQRTPSAAEMEAFQQLSPEQQKALLENMESQPSSLEPDKDKDKRKRLQQRGEEEDEEEDEEEELRLEPRGALIVETRLPPEEDEDEIYLQDYEEFVEEFEDDIYRVRLLGTRYFKLDQYGVLNLPGIGAVPLAGLTDEEAAKRLQAEPLLERLEISVTILPLTPMGDEALKPFGYSLFEERPELFGIEPPESVPVPRDYVLGPGDTLRVQLYGEENYEVEFDVTTEGTINFPKIGPQSVAGMTFGEVKEAIERRVAEQMIGTQAAVSMGQLRTIRVFVVGDVKYPGAYDVSSLSRISGALYASGGITEVGSLRQIQLKRQGRTVATLDLYRLLLDGDTRNDAQLRSDDVVLIPPAGPTVGVDGEVRRPAIYELGSERQLSDVLQLAGGLRATADRERLQIERIGEGGVRVVETVDVTAAGASTPVRGGDIVRVFSVLEDVDGAVGLAGHVTRPGRYEWFPGMRISDLLPNRHFLQPKADLGYVLIRRESPDDRRAEVLSADLAAARAAPNSPADVPLAPGDHVTVFELGIRRSAAVEEILKELDAQASVAKPFQVVHIAGEIFAPGEYPLERDMRVSDLLRAGGGLLPSAHASSAELTRYRVGPEGSRQTELLTINLTDALAGVSAADVPLEPYDVLNIQKIPEWDQTLEVNLVGEFRFPGPYTVSRGEMLSSVIRRAGGLTDLAFVDGTVFTREVLKEREMEQLELLRARLQADVSTLALQRAQTEGGSAAEAYSIGQTLLQELETTEAQGRLVIDLPAILANPGDPTIDVVLRDGDELVVPPKTQEVMVVGEVQYATSHRFQPRLSRDDYIDQSGGLTVRADKKRIYIVRANGAVIAGKGSNWFRNQGQIQPGDTVVVPLDTDRLPAITQWASITQILFNLAIAAAAVNSF